MSLRHPAAGRPQPAVGTTRWFLEWAKSILVALVTWLFLRTFVVAAFRIPSESMEKTLLVGDWLWVTKALYGAEVPLIHRRLTAIRQPRRGDILVFDSVEEAGLEVVKRLIGLPGDTLAMQSGRLYRDGLLQPEPYAADAEPLKSESPEFQEKMRAWQSRHLAGGDPSQYHPDLHDWGPIVVPPDSLFVMGDNRDSSYDGRYWGLLPRRNVRGSPLIVYFSYDARSWRPLPFLTAIRWDRFFTRPR
jgi:signal peptidase I